MTTINYQQEEQPEFAEKPTFHAGTSEVSKSTLVTHGKRGRECDDEKDFNVPSLKRVKRESAQVFKDDQNSKSGNLDSNKLSFVQPIREVKSAPTSNNGSNNLAPFLDIQVTLPQGDLTEDEDDDVRKERRLQQNRVSAQKCRQKKKVEFNSLRQDYEKAQRENEELKFKIEQVNLMLFQKSEECELLSNQLTQVHQSTNQQTALKQLVMLLNSAQTNQVVTPKISTIDIQRQNQAALKFPPLQNLMNLGQQKQSGAFVQPTVPRVLTSSLSAFKPIITKQQQIGDQTVNKRPF